MFWRRKRKTSDFSEEIRSHLDLEADDLRSEGLSPDEARRAACRSFGNVAAVEERFYERRRWLWFDALSQDCRYSIRMMWMNPGFTLAVVLTLAIGIGANTAIFSLIDSVLLRLLPVREPSKLYFINNAGTRTDGTLDVGGSPPYPCFERIRRQTQSFAGMSAFTMQNEKIRLDGRLEAADISLVSGNMYEVLGLQPAQGRLLHSDDESLTAPAAVISHGYWLRRFGASPEAVGKTFSLDDYTFTIVGVLPRDFSGLIPGKVEDIAVPITIAGFAVTARQSWWFRIVARLKPGITPEQAGAEVSPIFNAYMDELAFSAEVRREHFSEIVLLPASRGMETLRKEFSLPLFALMSVVALVLLVACSNITNLLLARAAARRREFAVRTAIGAGRSRLMRQFMTETILLFLMGSVAGLLFARWSVGALLTFVSTGPMQTQITVRWDWPVLAFTAGVALLTAMVFGAAPILRALRPDPHAVLNYGERITPFGSRIHTGRALVVFQVALSLVLLMGAGLFLQTLANLRRVDPGFRPRNVITMSVELLDSTYGKPDNRAAAWSRLLEGVRRIPGVRSAGVSWMTPFDGKANGVDIRVPGFQPRSERELGVSLNHVSEDYFETLGIDIVAGREFEESDMAGAPEVVLINESAARFYFAGRNPVGASIQIPRSRTEHKDYRIVGVVKDVRHDNLRIAPERSVYVPVRQPRDGMFRLTLAMRAVADSDSIIAAARKVVQTTGSDIFVARAGSLSDQVDAILLRERVISSLSAGFGVLALLLSALGLFGVLAYSVARRTGEIGIRMALGARPRDIGKAIIRQTLVLVVMGIAIGAPCSVLAARAVESLLFGVTPADPWVLAGCAILLGLVSLAASYLPARRASRIDPLVALRML